MMKEIERFQVPITKPDVLLFHFLIPIIQFPRDLLKSTSRENCDRESIKNMTYGIHQKVLFEMLVLRPLFS